jgi:hypothetical protein
MRDMFGVMVSDAISKNNLKLATGALHISLSEYWRTGLPMCISHDAHRPIGWTLPVGIHMEPGLARLTAVSLLPENDEDCRFLERAYQRRLYDRVLESTGPFSDELKDMIGPALRGNEQLADLVTPALVSDGLARRCFPDLFDQEDKDCLINLESLEAVQPGVYKRGPLVLFAHPFFRRSLSRLNNLNVDLLSQLETLARNPDVVVRIRLDPDAVGLARQCREPIEMQYWRGPHFNDDLSRIPPGVTRHEADERQTLFSLVSRTEFWWQSRLNDSTHRREHIFEAEELREHYTFGSQEQLYGCRYVHSIIDEETNAIAHLDGSIREYTDESMVERLDQDIAHAGRHTLYTKYWRLDGTLPLSSWKTLIYHHFRDNGLVGEYLGMTSEVVPPPVRPVPGALSRLVPHAAAATGLRVAISYHRFDAEPLAGDRCISLLGLVRGAEEETKFVDAEFLDFAKFVRRGGLSLDVPPDVQVLAFEEHYHVFPLIRHRTKAAADQTLGVLRSFVSFLKSPERVLSASVSVVTDDVEMRLSLLGGSQALVDWLQRFTFPPQAADTGTDWVTSVSDYLNTLPAVQDEPALGTVIKADGIFFLPRVKIPREWITSKADGSWFLRLDAFNGGDQDIRDLVMTGVVKGTVCGFISRSTCTSCGGDYRSCLCIKCADPGVAERVDDFSLVSFHWTDRPA